jgi:hypothetical protein
MLSRAEIDRQLLFVDLSIADGDTSLCGEREALQTAKQLGEWLAEALRACDACGGWNQEEAVNRVARKWAGQP